MARASDPEADPEEADPERLASRLPIEMTSSDDDGGDDGSMPSLSSTDDEDMPGLAWASDAPEVGTESPGGAFAAAADAGAPWPHSEAAMSLAMEASWIDGEPGRRARSMRLRHRRSSIYKLSSQSYAGAS